MRCFYCGKEIPHYSNYCSDSCREAFKTAKYVYEGAIDIDETNELQRARTEKET